MRWAEQTIALAPFRESGYRRLMEAHVTAGDRAEALRVYERCRRLLADELGTYPSPEIESIYRTLLEAPQVDGRGAPAFEPPPEADVPGREPSRLGSRRLAVTLVAGALALAAVVGAAVVVLTRGGPGSGVAGVLSDSVGIFGAGTGRSRGQVSVGASPSAIAAGDGSIWVANVDAHTVSQGRPGQAGGHPDDPGRERPGRDRVSAAASSGSRTASTAPCRRSLPRPTRSSTRSRSETAPREWRQTHVTSGSRTRATAR